MDATGERLYAAYNRICQATDQAFINSANANMKRKFAGRINATIQKNLLNELRNLYLKKYRDLRTQSCSLLFDAATEKLPELEGYLVPMCEYHGGVCHEMKSCGRRPKR